MKKPHGRPLGTASLGRRTLLAAGALLPFGAMSRAWSRTATGRIVVGFPPGGAADGLARLLAERLRGTMADVVIVENRVGAASRIAVDHVRTAAADGSVLLLVPDGIMFLYPHVYKTLNYDPAKDFIPVTRLVNMPLVMFVGPAVPDSVKTVADYLVWAKEDPKRQLYATPAAGAVPHFMGAMLASAAGLDLQPVHYKGGAPAMQDLVGGQVPVMFGSVSDGYAMVQAGRARALAVSSRERSAAMPEVPTFLELGYGDVVVEVGLGVYAPANTPQAVVEEINAASLKALRTPEMQKAIRDWGFDPSGEGPAEFAARLKSENARWAEIVKMTNFTALE